MRFALALSVALNLLLLTSIVAARIDPGRGDGLVAQAMLGDADSLLRQGDARDAGSAGELLGILEGAGFGDEEIKRLVLGWLQLRYRAAYDPGAARYWEKGYSPGRDALAGEHAVDSAVRTALVEIFGDAAVADPAFEAAFRPLGPAYAFLGSRAQISLQERQLELMTGMARGADDVGRQRLLCRAEDARAADAESRMLLPAPDLTEEEDREYRLRFSPLAAQLRDAGIADDEADFRALFELVRQLEGPMAPSEQAEVREDLRARMGDQRFDRFWSIRDPIFAAIGEHLEGHGVPEYQRRAAYSIVNRSQEALLSLLGRHRNQESIVAASRRVEQDKTAALGRLLGAEIAGSLEAALSEISLRLSQGSATAC